MNFARQAQAGGAQEIRRPPDDCIVMQSQASRLKPNKSESTNETNRFGLQTIHIYIINAIFNT